MVPLNIEASNVMEVKCLDIFLIFMKFIVESEIIQYYQNNQNEEANFIINSVYTMVWLGLYNSSVFS